MKKTKKAIVIGAGFSGLAAASVLAKAGWEVEVLEKNSTVGGRARVLKKDGFVFDMGPSWYWMPDVMEEFFQRFQSTTSDHFELKRLDPSYQVIFDNNQTEAIPSDMKAINELFEKKEKGSSLKLKEFLDEAELNYKVGMQKFVYKPSVSLMEFIKADIFKASYKLNLIQPFNKHVRKFFKSEQLIQLMEFPVLFLGAMPKKIPALYSLMNYADFKLGTWYPNGGMGMLVKAFITTAEKAGAKIHLNTPVSSFKIENKQIVGVETPNGFIEADVVISSADYHFTDQKLLPKEYSNYSEKYWEDRLMAPSCLIYYLGINKKLPKLKHHNLFFEQNFDSHAKAIYETPQFPEKPLYYVCNPSKTDNSVAPEGMENIFILIPIAPGLKETPAIREQYFNDTVSRLEKYCGESIKEHIVSYTDYAGADFISDYNAFKGNAYGLANTLKQTAVLKPSIINKKISNLFYTGQLTVPGPGVPPAIISGQVVADYVLNKFKN
jgi:phytoene desaturase